MVQPNPSPAASGYASIMVPMDLDPETKNRVKLATGLADRFSSRLIGVAAQPIATPLYFEHPADGIAGIIELEQRRATEDLAATEAEFRRIVGTRNNVEWRQSFSRPATYVLEQACAADLIVANRPRHDEQAFGSMTIDSGDLVMDVGRPVLFVPSRTDFLSGKRIVVAWKNSREARRAVWDSLPLLKAAQDVFVVSIDANDPSAKDVAAYLGRHGIEANVLHRPESANAIANEIIGITQQEGADLIVSGAYGHSRSREWVLGGVTRDLLNHSPVCCLMAH